MVFSYMRSIIHSAQRRDNSQSLCLEAGCALQLGCAASSFLKVLDRTLLYSRKLPFPLVVTLIQESRCISLRTSFTVPSLSLVLCYVPFPSTGTLKVKRDYSPDFSIHSQAENDNVARNTGTCLFMIWTGLGCLLQCINSIVWNKNMINRAPVYCDICNSLDALSLERSFTLPHHSNPYSSRVRCCLTGFLTLHQSPAL